MAKNKNKTILTNVNSISNNNAGEKGTFIKNGDINPATNQEEATFT